MPGINTPALYATLGAIGFKIRRDTHVDMAALTSPTATFEATAPSGATKTWTATILGPTEGYGHIEYKTVSGDLDEAGTWIVRPKIIENPADEVTFPDAFQIVVKAVAAL